MAIIEDILSLKVAEISIIKSKYPASTLTRQSDNAHPIQQYLFIFADEEESADDYYYFLFDNLIAQCSRKFHARLARDREFRAAIRSRAESRLGKMKA